MLNTMLKHIAFTIFSLYWTLYNVKHVSLFPPFCVTLKNLYMFHDVFHLFSWYFIHGHEFHGKMAMKSLPSTGIPGQATSRLLKPQRKPCKAAGEMDLKGIEKTCMPIRKCFIICVPYITGNLPIIFMYIYLHICACIHIYIYTRVIYLCMWYMLKRNIYIYK